MRRPCEPRRHPRASRRRATRPRRPSSWTGTTCCSSVVSSQVDLHARFGGVVPEIASRAHVELLTPVVAEALRGGGRRGDGARSTRWPPPSGPGLVGALLVGRERGQGARARVGRAVRRREPPRGAPVRGVLEEPDLEPPLVVLLVSGGHTMLVAMEGHGRYRLLGQTIDDAAGEAFDKVARFLGLGYPGGPAIDRLGAWRATRRRSPSPGRCPTTALRLLVQRAQDRGRQPRAQAPRRGHGRRGGLVPGGGGRRARGQGPPGRRRQVGARACASAAGVAANSRLRERFLDACVRGRRSAGFLPSRAMCTDNAAMVAAAGLVAARSSTAPPPRHRRRPQPAAPPERRLSRPRDGGCPASPTTRAARSVSTRLVRVLSTRTEPEC